MKLHENLLAMDCAEQLVCGPVVQLFSCVGIDVAHHEVDVILLQMIKGSTFRDNTSDHFVGYFTSALLVGVLRIAEKDAGPELSGGPVALNRSWIRKLTAPVS